MNPVRVAYDSIACAYAQRVADELDDKPFDRDWLVRLAVEVPSPRRLLDLGCGPGHVMRYLEDLGASTVGVDLSPAMVDAAVQAGTPARLVVADAAELPLASSSIGGAIAYYSLIHTPRPLLPGLLVELHRVLRQGAPAMLAVHLGSGTVHAAEYDGIPISLDAELYAAREFIDIVASCGFAVNSSVVRAPYAHELQTERLYLWTVAS